MALETIISTVYLDVYDHDTTPSTIKTVALDSHTRYVRAYLQRRGDVYQPDVTATVKLTALRPDKIGVEATGSVIELVPASDGDEAVYGLEAEITQAMIAIPGVVRFQFKMEVDGEIIRTEIFNANNGIALDGQTTDWAEEYQGYNLDELVQKVDDLEDEIGPLKEEINDNLQNVSLLSSIIVSDIEDGYYSVNNGQKYDNSSSSNYRRSKSLIRVEELTLYYANISCMACCYDADKTFLSSIYFDTEPYKSKRKLTPANTAYIGLFASGAEEFTLTKVDGKNFVSAEYPYVSDSYMHIEKCWCAGTGSVSETENLDMLIVPVTAGEKYFISNNAGYNCLCMDATGTLISATSESRTPTGKVYTVPTGAVQMYVNIYRNRTKGVNAEMSDYLAKITKGKVLAIGDSITWLDGRQNYGGMAYVTGWQRWLRLAGYDVVSAGFSGYPYATGLDVVDGADYSIYKEIVTNAYSVSGYDYIIMFGGTNDVLHGGALGDRPTDYSNRTFDASKFNGAIGAIISYIRTNNGTAKILLASFPKSEAVSRSFSNAFSRVEEIRYNCEFWSCRHVPIFSEINVQPTYDQFDTYFYDATHPNFNGMKRIGELMLTAVENY